MRDQKTRILAAIVGATLTVAASEHAASATILTNTGYVCAVGLTPNGVDPSGGSYGYIYVELWSLPACSGSALQSGYVYSLNASASGVEWQPAWRYSEAGLNSTYQMLVEAAQQGKRVRLIGSNLSPYQIQSVMVYGN